jgi:macrolide-specific efflux system membrane fusion protein
VQSNKSLEVVGSFAEADVANLKVGQSATISFPAIDSETGTGTVTAISPTATTSNSVTTYAATIRLDDYPDTLRLGQTATVSVTTKSAEDVLYVPSNAVKIGTDATQGTVTVIDGNKQTTTSVGIGVQGDSTVEVTSGLSEGQKVLISTDTSTGASSSTTTNERGGMGNFGGGNMGGMPSMGGGPSVN